MMDYKILKPYTIVPDELYIERVADRQLEHVIKDMGRPGYVLVSRQMGKTNLLLNAKRKFQTEEDLYVYIDLSNSFNEARSYFRYFIDLALETNPGKLKSIQKEIENQRKESSIPEHIEHGRELRLILNSIKGKLVIILDEIDALTRSNYSDKIFAQIRSTYFDRVNFVQYNRLTYILSGVVDPLDIIKDPKISPFNIGQKIFLGDFTETEVRLLVDKAHISLPEPVFKRLYQWTSGHPRITFDVLSEVEDRVMDGKIIDELMIDSIVENTYLTAFDKAPIDNIRELIEKDEEIRDAIVKIQSSVIFELRNDLKRKLYLYGIISSDYEINGAKIKNRIVKEAISLEWIRQIERKRTGLLALAESKYQKNQYEEAIKYFEEYQSENKTTTLTKIQNYELGLSYYKTGLFANAIRYLETGMWDKSGYANAYFDTTYILGLCYFRIGDFERSILKFQEVIDSATKTFYYHSLLNLASAKYRLNKVEFGSEFVQRNLDLLDKKDEIFNFVEIAEVNKILSTASFNLGLFYEEQTDFENAFFYYTKALNESPYYFKPKILTKLCSLEKDISKKKVYVESLLSLFDKMETDFSQMDVSDELIFQEDILIDAIAEIYLIDDRNALERLLANIGKQHKLKYSNKEILLFYTGVSLLNKNHSNAAFNSLRDSLRFAEENDVESLIYLNYKYLAYFLKEKYYQEKYVTILARYSNLEELGQFINSFDYRLFINLFSSYIEKNNYVSAEKLIESYLRHDSYLNETEYYNLVIIYHYSLLLSVQKGSSAEVIRDKAKKVITFLKENRVKIQGLGVLIDKKQLSDIEKYAMRFENFELKQVPYRHKEIKYLPNQRITVQYMNGTKRENVKYKTVQSDIAEGKCFIVN